MFTRKVEETDPYGKKTGKVVDDRVWKECTELDEKTALSIS